jgi:hypothetical protein
LEQALLLRSSRDFSNRVSYEGLLGRLFAQRNRGRQQRLTEEIPLLRPLPARRLEACQRLHLRVDTGSTIHVRCNTYSVASRLIGERVEVRVYAECLEVWYAQQQVETLPRLRGRGKHHISYRHVIDWLVRKPGAFADYCYRQDLFPSSRFRLAYDLLRERQPERASKEYVQILYLAARRSEAGVEAALVRLLAAGRLPDAATVEAEMARSDKPLSLTTVTIGPVDLASYDALLEGKEADDDRGDGRSARAAGEQSEGTTPAGVPVELRGTGAAGATGGAELRAVPAGTDAARMLGASTAADRAAVTGVASSTGEELVGAGPEASAGQGGAAGAFAAGGRSWTVTRTS